VGGGRGALEMKKVVAESGVVQAAQGAAVVMD
jgi:hypothetical protein